MAITGSVSSLAPSYFGPNPSTYVFDVYISTGTNVTILWRESSYFYVEFIYQGALRRDYVEQIYITGIQGGTPTTYTPTLLTRYVFGDGYARFGPSTSYSIHSSLAYRQSVQYLDGKKIGDFAFIEYTETGATKKKRGWFEHMKLTIIQATPQIYTDGHVLNSDGEYWDLTNPWTGIGAYQGHLGIDIRRNSSGGVPVSGKEVYAIAAGIVVCSELGNGNGNCMIIQHTTSIGNVYYSMYCHLASRYYGLYTSVSAGDAIGIMGNTGDSDGEHLHINITKDNRGAGTYGYNMDADGNRLPFTTTAGYWDTSFVRNSDGYSIVHMNTRYYNPTQYFNQGVSLIDNNY